MPIHSHSVWHIHPVVPTWFVSGLHSRAVTDIWSHMLHYMHTCACNEASQTDFISLLFQLPEQKRIITVYKTLMWASSVLYVSWNKKHVHYLIRAVFAKELWDRVYLKQHTSTAAPVEQVCLDKCCGWGGGVKRRDQQNNEVRKNDTNVKSEIQTDTSKRRRGTSYREHLVQTLKYNLSAETAGKTCSLTCELWTLFLLLVSVWIGLVHPACRASSVCVLCLRKLCICLYVT